MNSEPQPAAFMMMQFSSKCSSFSRLFLPFLRGFLSAEVLWGNQCQFSSSIFPFCQIPSAPKTSSMIMIVFNFQWLVSSNFKVLTWLLSLLPFALSSNNGSRINSFFFVFYLASICLICCVPVSYLLVLLEKSQNILHISDSRAFSGLCLYHSFSHWNPSSQTASNGWFW